ncbi:MAG: Vps62-related protein [Chitinophagales bacterium]
MGDWEHLTVRLMWDCVGHPCEILPYEVYLSQHSGGDTKAWADIEKVNNSPIVYAARGSHAMYFTEGAHNYKHIPLLGDLIDRCSKGSVFNSSQSNKVEAYDFQAKKGLNNNVWPVWMSADFKTAGSNPADPASGGNYRWGNAEQGCHFGQCRLEDGPTGPISKGDVWNVNVFEK